MIDIDVFFTIVLSLVMIYGAVLHYQYWSRDNAGLPNTLYRRKIIGGSLSAGGVLVWFFCSALYLYYDRTRSNIADEQAGTIHALTNHGHVVYVTWMERNSLLFLVVSAGLLFVSGYLLDRNVRKAAARAGQQNQST
jgi:hypothetical protein